MSEMRKYLDLVNAENNKNGINIVNEEASSSNGILQNVDILLETDDVDAALKAFARIQECLGQNSSDIVEKHFPDEIYGFVFKGNSDKAENLRKYIEDEIGKMF